MSKVKMPELGEGRLYVISPAYTGDVLTAEAAEAYAAARVAEAMESSGWQPIKTAPRDGTEFQTWLGFWEPRCRFRPDSEGLEIWGRVDYDLDGWADASHLTATHWMPQPAAPSP